MGHHRHEGARIPNPVARRGKPKRQQRSKMAWARAWRSLHTTKTGWEGNNVRAIAGTKAGASEVAGRAKSMGMDVQSPGFLKRLLGRK